MNAGNTVSQHRFWGETTAFLALFFDNVGVLIFFSAILVFTFNYPAEIILTRMIPGTAGTSKCAAATGRRLTLTRGSATRT